MVQDRIEGHGSSNSGTSAMAKLNDTEQSSNLSPEDFRPYVSISNSSMIDGKLIHLVCLKTPSNVNEASGQVSGAGDGNEEITYLLLVDSTAFNQAFPDIALEYYNENTSFVDPAEGTPVEVDQIAGAHEIMSIKTNFSPIPAELAAHYDGSQVTYLVGFGFNATGSAELDDLAEE